MWTMGLSSRFVLHEPSDRLWSGGGPSWIAPASSFGNRTCVAQADSVHLRLSTKRGPYPHRGTPYPQCAPRPPAVSGSSPARGPTRSVGVEELADSRDVQ